MSKKLGNLIKEGRTKAGLTQAELAAQVDGLSAAALGKAERGESEPTQAQVKEIAKVVGVTQKSLLDAMSKRASSSSGKSTSAKKSSSSGKSSSAKKTSASTKKSASASLKLTQAEKTLVELYRKADAGTKKAAVSLLKGESSGSGLLDLFKGDGAGSLLSDLLKDSDGLGSLLGGSSSGSENSGSLLSGLLGSLTGGK